MKTFLVLALLGAASCALAQDNLAPVNPAPVPLKPTLWLVGDSTVNNGTKGQMGWGTVLPKFFDADKIRIENRARGGRSSRTFYTEGLWKAVEDSLKPGDFVLMQFGHNDGGATYIGPRGRSSIKGNGDETKDVTQDDGKAETVHSFGWYERQYIEGAKAKGATPIVLSLVPRNDWVDGKVARANTGYGLYAKQAAEQEKAAFVDLNEIVGKHYDELGQTKVATFFPNEHTHTNEEGATLNAQAVVEGLRALPGDPFAAYVK